MWRIHTILYGRKSLTEELKFVDRTFQKLLNKKDTELVVLRDKLEQKDRSERYIPMKSTFIEEYLVPVLRSDGKSS